MTTIPQVLFIDDKYDTIAVAIKSFLDNGFQVQYWNGSDEPPSSIYNPRIVIVDLDLNKVGLRTGTDADFVSSINALEKIAGPFIVIIVAQEYQEEDPQKLERLLTTRKNNFCGYIAKDGLKKELLEDTTCLQNLVSNLLKENLILRLIVSWEKIFDKAKDKALSEIAINNVSSSVEALLKILCNDFNESDISARELIEVFMRLVSRKTCMKEDLEVISELIDQIFQNANKDSVDFEQQCLVYNRLMYYLPHKDEMIMTGDIFETFDEYKYAIVLTPKCDLIQSKTQKALVCYGFPLDKKILEEHVFPPNIIDTTIVDLKLKGSSKETILKALEKTYIKGKMVPKRFYMLWNYNVSDTSLGFCFNLNNVQSVEIKNINQWDRICRLDSPYIEEMINQYGNNASRVGTLPINRSPHYLQNVMKKIEEKIQEENSEENNG